MPRVAYRLAGRYAHCKHTWTRILADQCIPSKCLLGGSYTRLASGQVMMGSQRKCLSNSSMRADQCHDIYIFFFFLRILCCTEMHLGLQQHQPIQWHRKCLASPIACHLCWIYSASGSCALHYYCIHFIFIRNYFYENHTHSKTATCQYSEKQRQRRHNNNNKKTASMLLVLFPAENEENERHMSACGRVIWIHRKQQSSKSILLAGKGFQFKHKKMHCFVFLFDRKQKKKWKKQRQRVGRPRWWWRASYE